MGINDILRKAEALQKQKAARAESFKPKEQEPLNESIEQRGTALSRTEAAAETRRAAEDRESQKRRTLPDFVEYLADMCCSKGGLRKVFGVRFEYPQIYNVHVADIYVDDLGENFSARKTYLHRIDRETRHEITDFFAARFGTGDQFRLGMTKEGREKYDWVSGDGDGLAKIWHNREDGKWKLHLRLKIGKEEYEAAAERLAAWDLIPPLPKVLQLHELVELIHKSDWADRKDVFDLRWRDGKATIFIGDFSEEALGTMQKTLMKRFGGENVGRNGLFDRRQMWVSEGSTHENVISGMKIWSKGGFGYGGEMKTRMEITLKVEPEEFAFAQHKFVDFAGEYASKQDEKKRKVVDFIRHLREREIFGEGEKHLPAIRYKDNVVEIEGKTSHEKRLKGAMDFFSARFYMRKEDREKVPKYRYDWTGGNIAGEGKDAEPACFLKTSDSDRLWEYKYRIKFSPVSYEEYEAAKRELRAMNGGAAHFTVEDALETAIACRLTSRPDEIDIIRDGNSLKISIPCDSEHDYNNISIIENDLAARFGSVEYQAKAEIGGTAYMHMNPYVWVGKAERNREGKLVPLDYLKKNGRIEIGGGKFYDFELVLNGIGKEEEERAREYLENAMSVPKYRRVENFVDVLVLEKAIKIADVHANYSQYNGQLTIEAVHNPWVIGASWMGSFFSERFGKVPEEKLPHLNFNMWEPDGYIWVGKTYGDGKRPATYIKNSGKTEDGNIRLTICLDGISRREWGRLTEFIEWRKQHPVK